MYALFLCFSRNMELIYPFAPYTADDSMNYVFINKTSVYTVALCQIGSKRTRKYVDKIFKDKIE